MQLLRLALIVCAIGLGACGGDDGPTEPQGCVELGSPCVDVNDCCAESPEAVLCATVPGDTMPTCVAGFNLCRGADASCELGSDCCSDACIDNVCQCGVTGDECDPQAPADCCTPLACNPDTFRCDAATTITCMGDPCVSPTDCCEHATCLGNQCSCGMQSSECVDNADCCEGLICLAAAGCQFP